MFFAIYSYIPLIVVGKPGCSKSLSIQLIIRIMRGELSSSKFLKNFPTINSTGFQGSETNTPESIENIFKVWAIPQKMIYGTLISMCLLFIIDYIEYKKSVYIDIIQLN